MNFLSFDGAIAPTSTYKENYAEIRNEFPEL